MFCSPRPACASSFVCAAWSVPCAVCVCLLVARSCCHCAACRVAPSPRVIPLWCCLLCSVLVLCVAFALVSLVSLFVASTFVPGLCISLVCISSLLVYISSWSVYLSDLYLVIASSSLPGLYIFLVCISSLRFCLFVCMVDLRVRPFCLPREFRVFSGYSVPRISSAPTFLSTSNFVSALSFLSASNLCASLKIRAFHENREMHEHMNTTTTDRCCPTGC